MSPPLLSSLSLTAVAVGTAALLTFGAAGDVAATTPAAPPTAVAIPNAATDVAIGPLGEISVATGTSLRSRRTITARRLDPAGAALKPLPLLQATAKHTFLASDFVPDGVLVSYTQKDPRFARGPLRAFTKHPDGSASPTQTLTSPRTIGARVGVTVGPNGAVAYAFYEGEPGRKQSVRIALRPAGATAFGKSAVIQSPAEIRAGLQFETILGPDGGGAVVVRPPDFHKGRPYVRRLSPTGAVGPKIPIAARYETGARLAAAMGPSGTLVIAVLTDGPPNKKAAPPSDLVVTTLAPGAAATTPPQRIDRGSQAGASNENLAVAVGPDDHTVILAGSDPDTDDIGGPDSDVIAQRIYEGTGAAVKLVDRLTAWFPSTARITLAPDGAVTAIWAENQTQSAQGDHLTAGIFGAHRAPGGAFSTPRLISSKAPFDGDRIQDLTQLADGRIAVQYLRYDEGTDPGRSYVLIAQP